MTMTISTENLLKGLNIGLIDVEPIHNGDDTFSYRNKNWSWCEGEKFGLTCHLEVYANQDFSFEIYTNNIEVITDDCYPITLSEQQKIIIEKEIKNNINILTLQA